MTTIEIIESAQKLLTRILPEEWTKEETEIVESLTVTKNAFTTALNLLREQYLALDDQSVLTDEEQNWCDKVDAFLYANNYLPSTDND